ncbi:hypothetical protein MBLNU459_g1176t1 [Dothideomycetes sp. NU459]
MAPDVPSSPQLLQPGSSTSSRRPSHSVTMPPPASPFSHSMQSPNIQGMTTADASIPVRQSRPLSAAELHLEMEKEQEAVVNRLTRELSALRAQHSASMASNASQSSSASNTPSILPIDPNDPIPIHQLTGPTHPTPSRRHRSSSTASSRSITTPSTSTSSAVSTAQPPLAPPVGVSQASADRAAAAGNLSRNPSVRSTSGTSTPARPSIDYSSSSGFPNLAPHRPSISQATSFNSVAGSTIAHVGSPNPGVSSPSQQYADAASARSELDIVKAENESLRQRIRSLERALRARRESSQSDANHTGRDRSSSRQGLNVSAWAAGTSVAGPRERSESQSTTASSRPGIAGEDRDDVVKVGESAATVGIGARNII